jgi:hypothetical protein
MRARLLWLGAGLVLVGCSDDRVYVGKDKIYQVALTADTPAAIQSKMGGALYIVETRADLPITPPTNAELADRMSGARAYKN